jgi:sugar-phosphatase
MKQIGFLFDLDGTLVNSQPSVDRVWTAVSEEAGVPLSELGKYHGLPAITVWRELMPDASEEVIQRYNAKVLELEIEEAYDVVAVPGAHELLEELNSRNIPWTIVTSGVKSLATARTKFAGIKLPEHAVTFDQVTQGKPFPEPFILGAKRIGLDPSLTWAVEDAPGGIRSAKLAGCTVCSVATTNVKEDLHEADHHLENVLDLLTIAGIK